MDTALFVAGVVVVVALRIFIYVNVARRRRRPELIETHDRKRLAKPAPRVTIKGRVRLRGEPITAALSGRSCVAYLARAHVFHAKQRSHLIGELSESKAARFAVEHADGEVEIDPAHVIVDARARRLAERDEAREHAYLAVRNVDQHHAASQFEEALVADGDVVTVVGRVAVDDQGDAGFRDAPVRRRLAGSAQQPLEISV